MQDPCLSTASDAAQRLRVREFSATELLQAHLQRVQRLNPALNAVVVLREEAALQRARQADEARARGHSWGPLHGVPMTIKEAFDWVGTPTTMGYEAQRHNIASTNAVAVQRLLDAGAVIYGKTNVPVALADWQSFNPVYGTSHNPWDLSRSPGGSSGGSAAALAAGLSMLELGSDIGASIRNPSHYCGVYGHKPTWGVVPMQGHELPGQVGADAIDIGAGGPMARSAHDLTLALDVLSAPLTAYGPMGRTPMQWRDVGRAPRQMRVAMMADDSRAEVDAEVRNALLALADFLRRSGVQVDTEARPVDSETAWRVYVGQLRGALCGQLSEADYAKALQQAALCSGPVSEFPAAHWKGFTQSHRDWLLLEDQRHVLRQQWASFFERFDLLICPVAATTAMVHNQQGYRWERMIPVNGKPQPSTTQLFWAGYPGLVGLPATAVPLGLSPSGLPIGAQLVGPAFGDPVCLRFARWMEEAYRAFVPPPMALQAV
jgi:amidase